MNSSWTPLPVTAFPESANRHDLFFNSNGLQCHAWFFTPSVTSIQAQEDGNKVPVVVMAHGFGAQKDFSLERYAKNFAAEGLAVLVFDYRYWGGSEGQPRHLLEVKLQHEDWFAALDFVQDELQNALTDKEINCQVNTKRIGIWGSSFAGGHVVAVAGSYARKENIRAVVSQVPYSDGATSLPALLSTMGPIWAARLVANSVKDIIYRTLGGDRHYMSIIQETLKETCVDKRNDFDEKDRGSIGIIATGECSNYWRIIKEDQKNRLGGWKNLVPASIALEFPLYRPVTYAKHVTAPTLGIVAIGDSLCPYKGVKKMFKNISGPVELKQLPGGHFDAYLEDFEKVCGWEVEFLVKRLI